MGGTGAGVLPLSQVELVLILPGGPLLLLGETEPHRSVFALA